MSNTNSNGGFFTTKHMIQVFQTKDQEERQKLFSVARMLNSNPLCLGVQKIIATCGLQDPLSETTV